MPKKTVLVKGRDANSHLNYLVVDGQVMFFQSFDGPWIPALRLVHKYPGILPQVQVDRGAIKFILSGANIMCPGLTSAGARMETQLPAGTIVAVMAEGKQHACAVGLMKLSTEEIRQVNKGIGVDNLHYLNDDLWAGGPMK